MGSLKKEKKRAIHRIALLKTAEKARKRNKKPWIGGETDGAGLV